MSQSTSRLRQSEKRPRRVTSPPLRKATVSRRSRKRCRRSWPRAATFKPTNKSRVWWSSRRNAGNEPVSCCGAVWACAVVRFWFFHSLSTFTYFRLLTFLQNHVYSWECLRYDKWRELALFVNVFISSLFFPTKITSWVRSHEWFSHLIALEKEQVFAEAMGVWRGRAVSHDLTWILKFGILLLTV